MFVFLFWLVLYPYLDAVAGGPYSPAAGESGSTAVHKDNLEIVAWASGWQDYEEGSDVTSNWQDPYAALGQAEGTAFDIVSLGRGGMITLTFDDPMKNGDGWDFAVYENAFNDNFLELAYVEVSSDGETFIRFENDSLTTGETAGSVDPTNISGLAGKYRQGYGTPFDLRDLATNEQVRDGVVNLARISHVRLIDIVGNGNALDSTGDPIYDPYPTTGSAGFDLDGVGVRYENTLPAGANDPPNPPVLLSPLDGQAAVILPTSVSTLSFTDPNADDVHLLTEWKIATDGDFSSLVYYVRSNASLTSIRVPEAALIGGSVYHWKARFYDGEGAVSDWSDVFSFETAVTDGDEDGVPDDAEVTVAWNRDDVVASVVGRNTEGEEVNTGLSLGMNVSSLLWLEPVDIASTEVDGRPDHFPGGIIGFNVAVDNADVVAEVTVSFSEPVPADARWYKYDSVNGWRVYEHATFADDGRHVVLRLKDGDSDYGDIDGVKNGIIVDPGGAGYSAPGAIPADDPAGFGGGGGCFVNACEMDSF